MAKNLLVVLWCILFSITLSFSQEAHYQSISPTPNSITYTEQELDSISYQLLDSFNKGFYDQILEKTPALIKNAQNISNCDLERRFSNILGNSYIKLDDIVKAELFFKEALKVAKEKNDTLSILTTYVNLGNTYFNTDRPKAVAYLKKGIAYEYQNDRHDQINFILHHNLAELYVDLHNPKLAKDHLKQIEYKMDLESMEARRKTYLGTTNFIKAGIHLLENNPKESIKTILESLKYKEAYDENYLVGNYKNLMTAYELLGQYEKLPEVHKVYDSLKDARYEKDKIKQQQIARTEVQLDKIEQDLRASQLENELVTQKASVDQMLLIFFIVIAVLLLVVIILLFKAKSKRERFLDGLVAKNKQYLEAKEKSEKLAKSNTRFLSTISHELRTPLYGIVGLSASFIKDPNLSGYKDEMKSLKFSADYLLALVNDVLHINKFSSKQGHELKEMHFDLSVLLENIKHTFTFLNEKHNNKVLIDLDPSIPPILYGDKMKISQVLMNLMSNASKFTEDGNISLKINNLKQTEENIRLLFEVKDSGRGIHPDDQKSVFEEFTQVKDAHDQEMNGTGLGLPIVNKILSILDSSLHMDSIFNEGTTFSFILDIQVGEKEQELQQTPSKNIASLENKKVLIVDDNKINQIVTQKILEQHSMKHQTANNGKEAVDIVQKELFDFILMDINMPVMNGIEASQKIREFDKKTPIIALTATDFEDPQNEVYRYGVNSIIVKPYETELLLHSLLRELAPIISEKTT
jgi:signal transduction histidine kinase/CheY-like chemotaxis protein